MKKAVGQPDGVGPVSSTVRSDGISRYELRRRAAADRMVDYRAVIIGVCMFAMVVAWAYWSEVKAREDVTKKKLNLFEFATEEPKKEDFKPQDPQREIIRETPEQPPKDDEKDETPNIQISTHPVEVEIMKEVVKTDIVEVRDDFKVAVKDMDLVDTPEKLDEIKDVINMPLTPIAALSSKPADMYVYKEPTPPTERAIDFLRTAPSPNRKFGLKPPQIGDQDAPTMGELGPVDINLFGTGDRFRRRMLGRGMETRSAVDAALHWLALHQEADGSWNGLKWNPDNCPPSGVLDASGQPLAGGSGGITGMALMALMSGGHTIRKGEYRANVLRGMEWLIKKQRTSGQLFDNMYEHAICTITLSEAHARSPDERIGVAARKSVDFCVQAVGLDNGWRYTPNVEKSDLSVTAWFVQALKAAKLARIKFDERCFAKALTFVDRMTDKGGVSDSNGTAAYTYDEEPGSRPSMTAAAMVIRQFTGTGAKSAMLIKSAEFLKRYEPNWDRKRDFYFWYYATYAMHNMGGEYRIWWNGRMRDVLLEHQVRSGHQAGSWSCKGVEWAERENAGRVYCTALGALCLEVYYRYTEALQSFGTAPELNDLFFE